VAVDRTVVAMMDSDVQSSEWRVAEGSGSSAMAVKWYRRVVAKMMMRVANLFKLIGRCFGGSGHPNLACTENGRQWPTSSIAI